MNVAMISFSAKGEALGKKLSQRMPDWPQATRCTSGMLSPWTAAHFDRCDALIFIGSCGIAVRAIAPYVTSKTADPAVLVIDELGTYCIPILSGHLGGANGLAADVAKALDALAVITTATDINHVFAVDAWAKSQGLGIDNPARIKWISARLLAGETVKLKSSLPLGGSLPNGIALDDDGYDILISHRTRGRKEALRLIPPTVVLGIGCKKGVPIEAIEPAYQLMLARANCHPLAVCKVCSIDLKSNEPGILAFCAEHQLPYETFSPAQLNAVDGSFSASAFVKSVTGVDNVCERSAVCGCGAEGRLIAQKDAGNGITMALAMRPYSISF